MLVLKILRKFDERPKTFKMFKANSYFLWIFQYIIVVVLRIRYAGCSIHTALRIRQTSDLYRSISAKNITGISEYVIIITYKTKNIINFISKNIKKMSMMKLIFPIICLFLPSLSQQTPIIDRS